MEVPSASRELSTVDLGDARLNRRAARIVGAVERNPGVGFPQIFGDETALMGFYRFVNNDSVGHQDVLAALAEQAWTRGIGHAERDILVVHDTTQFSFKGESGRLGLVQKGNKSIFEGHFAIAVAESEVPRMLGVVGMHAYTVEDGAWLRYESAEEVEELLSGSERWGDLVAEVHHCAPARARCIHVADREADNYALWWGVMDLGDDFVFRVAHDRKLGAEQGRMKTILSGEPFRLRRNVYVSARSSRRPPKTLKSHPPRGARSASLAIRAMPVSVQRPVGVGPLGTPTLELNLVEVVEEPTNGVSDPVRWLIVTTLPIATDHQIARIVDIYRKRWLIEEFFRALKSGCAYEKRQGESLQALLVVMTLLLPVAWRLLTLRTLARLDEQAPATDVFDAVELQALRALSKKKRLPKRPTVRQAMLAVAGVGGHLKSNGEPGWIVLGRGLESLLDFAQGWKAAMSAMAEAADG